jgi:xylulokinase
LQTHVKNKEGYKMDYILSFDVGTSTLKGILVGKDGHVVANAAAEYHVNFPREGFVEEDPMDWWNAIISTTHEIMNKSGIPVSDVKGMVFATQAVGVIPMGDDGKVMHPAIIWLDSRADEEANEIVQMMGGPEVCESLMGTTFSGKDSLPKVRWLMKNKPEMFKKMSCFLDVNGFLIYCATGEMVYDMASASCLGYDKDSGSIIGDLISLSGYDPEKFPRIVKSFDCVGNLTEKAAMELGLSQETRVFGGTNDMQSTAIGSGMTGNNEAHFCLGTSGWVVALTERNQVLTNGGACIMSADPEKYLWFYSTETACATFNWFLDDFYEKEKNDPSIPNFFEFVNNEAALVPPGADYLIFNPWLSGERCPINDMYVRGGFLNIGLSHTRRHMLRAVMESIVYNLRWACESLEKDLGQKIPTVRILGGGSKSKVWMQMFADILGRKVELVQDSQIAGAIGGAFLAAKGLGMYNSFEEAKEWARIKDTFEPNVENTKIYEEMYQLFQDSYSSLKEFYVKANKERFGEK